MGHGGASTAFLQVIQGADLTGHFELVVMEETINGSPFGSQTNSLPAKLQAETDCARDSGARTMMRKRSTGRKGFGPRCLTATRVS